MLYLLLLAATTFSTGKTVFMKKIGVNSNTADKLIRQNAVSFAVSALIPLIMLRFDFLKIFVLTRLVKLLASNGVCKCACQQIANF